MMSLFSDIDAWLAAVWLGLLMGAAWGLGMWLARRFVRPDEKDAAGQFSGASLALLGLLLAFTFSMSMERHERRRSMIIQHANAIGDFAASASFLHEPLRSQLRGVLRQYVEYLLTIPKLHGTEAEIQQVLAEDDRLQGEMQALAGQALQEGTSVAVPLVMTFNNMTSSHESRLAAARNRLPLPIVVLLFLSAAVSMLQIGLMHRNPTSRDLATGAGFIVLVGLCVWVILDLNQFGGITAAITQEPIERILSGLKTP
jgi:drug/metabolite transporter (DMT)-like permease